MEGGLLILVFKLLIVSLTLASDLTKRYCMGSVVIGLALSE